jgi:signal transduction histidine kinase
LPKRFIAGSDLNIGVAHFKMGNFDNALDSFEAALEGYSEDKSESGILQTLAERGTVYNDYGQPERAMEDCQKSKELALKIGDAEYLIKACECLYKAHNSIGNFKTSLENHELYVKIKDSLFNEKNVRKTTQLGMEFEFSKKEAVQQLLIEKKNREKNNLIIGVIALGVFALTIFAFFRKRLKYQKTISTQEKSLQKQAIVELKQQNKLIAMNSMIEGQEAERLRIAKDLHDSLGGLLSTVKAHFTSIQEVRTGLSEVPLARKTNELIDEACIEVRRISHNMMPHALSISGLEGAVQDITDNLIAQGYNATFEGKNISKIEATKEIMIYRLIQEIVSNIRKHAEAKTIFLQLFGYQNAIHLTVEDDGRGFNYEKESANGGLGLKSINSRVSFLDGEIHWDTQPGNGTHVLIEIPVE